MKRMKGKKRGRGRRGGGECVIEKEGERRVRRGVKRV